MSDRQMSLEEYDKRFGIIAIEKGFINVDQLVEGLRVQINTYLETRKHMLIGEILLDKGSLGVQQLGEVLQETFKH